MHWNFNEKEKLIHAFKLANSEHLLKLFFEDLFTEAELDLFAQRLKAALLILDGAPYSHIQTATGLSSATIARISKKLVDKKGGFQMIYQKFNPHGGRYSD